MRVNRKLLKRYCSGMRHEGEGERLRSWAAAGKLTSSLGLSVLQSVTALKASIQLWI